MRTVTYHYTGLLLVVLVLSHYSDGLSMVAVFNRLGVSGNIIFNQSSPSSMVDISLYNIHGLTLPLNQWAIHSLPLYPLSTPDPCSLVVGTVYRDLSEHSIGDQPIISISNDVITLYGNDSIVGRSLVITESPTLTVCASIGPGMETMVTWASLRSNGIANGNVFLWQQSNRQLTTIFVSITTMTNISSLILSIVSDCTSIQNGNETGQNWNLTVEEGGIIQQLISTSDLINTEGLILSLRDDVDNNTIICTTIQSYIPIHVVGDIDGYGNVILLTQQSPLHPTEVYFTIVRELTINTLPPTTSEGCSHTGGVYDPRGVTLEEEEERGTLDTYAFGDISRKSNKSSVYSDLYLPLSGMDSVVGRALVLKEDNGDVSGCGFLRYAGELIEMRADLIINDISVIITFIQSPSNHFTDTIITIVTNITTDTPPSIVIPSSPIVPSTMVTMDTMVPSLVPSPMMSSPMMSSPSTPTNNNIPPTTSDTISRPSPTSYIQTVDTSSLPTLLMPLELSITPSFTYPQQTSSTVFLLMPDSIIDQTTTTQSVVGGGGMMMMNGGKRKREVGEFNWSLRQWNNPNTIPDNCEDLTIIGSSTDECSESYPLSCATGDLTGKHGPLQLASNAVIYHDPYLPLSGPNSVEGAVLLIQQENEEPICVLVTMATSAMATSPIPIPTSYPSTSQSMTSSSVAPPTTPPTKSVGNDNIILIGATVGGVVGAALLVTVILFCVCLCIRRLRTGQVDLIKRGKESGNDVELGQIRQRMDPQIGSDQYRAVCSYKPKDTGSDDLVLEEGEWVTLLEAPYGGEWWRGQGKSGEGWFPKSHVEYVDRETERKKAVEDNFKIAAAAIVAASNSFSGRHGTTLVTNKSKSTSTLPSDNGGRSTTTLLTKTDINSTPVMTAKFDITPLDAIVSENQRHISVSTTASEPNTPQNDDVIVNDVSMETGPSQSSSDSVEPLMRLEPYLVKYNYDGGTDIELPLKKGEIVSVLEKTDNGWWQGVSGGRVGWFPAAYVKPLPSKKRDEVKKDEDKKTTIEDKITDGLLDMEESLKSDTVNATEYRAIHTFKSDEDGDLQFEAGDNILVYWVHDNGWWYGSNTLTTTTGGDVQHGWFPGTYVELNEALSAAPSPLPLEGYDISEEVKSEVNKSPAKRRQRRKWSFKRAKSQEELTEAGMIPLIPEIKDDTTKTQTRPRRKAPPPPKKALSTAAFPTSQHLTTSQTTPISQQTTPTPNEKEQQQHPVAKQRKRRTTASALDPKRPRRLPPSPPTTSALTPPITATHPPTITEEVPLAPVSDGATQVAPASAGATPLVPPRHRYRVKRVKRPATRLIPPPPTIPLPPPPPITHKPSTTSHPQHVKTLTHLEQQTTSTVTDDQAITDDVTTASKPATNDVITDDDTSAIPVNKNEVTTTVVETNLSSEETVPKSPIRSPVRSKPPPIKPKPAHLSKKLSASNIYTERPTQGQGSPKPPPPTRSSSLHQQTPPKRRQPKLSLVTISDTISSEEVDHTSGHLDSQETAEAVRNLRSSPPSHPPPPRPQSADPDSSKRRSNPPSFPPPQRPTTSTTTDADQQEDGGVMIRSNSLKKRGSQLMRSLKKIVQKSEEEDTESKSSPVNDDDKDGAVFQNLQTASPVTSKKKELKKTTSSNIPARPPPPPIVRQTSSSERTKTTPTRPPPPKLITKTTTDMKQPTTVNNNHTHSSLPTSVGSSPVHSTGSPTSLSRSASPQLPSSFYRVKCDYTPQTSSELTLHVGDILIEIDRPTPTMYYGMLDDGTTGLFPTSAIEPLVTPANKI